MSDQDPATVHRLVAGHFGAIVAATEPDAWDDPSPVAEWRARDVVGHLVTWLPGFLESGAGVRLPAVPSVEDDPVAAWGEHAAAVQALLDDPATADRVLANRHVGDVALPEAIDRFYTSDVFMHTWDLARATGQEPGLDLARCEELLQGMEPLDEVLRSSGQYGPRMPVGDDAPAQDRLMAFVGRDPAWRSARAAASAGG